MAIRIPETREDAGILVGEITVEVGQRLEIPVAIDGDELEAGRRFVCSIDGPPIEMNEDALTITDEQVAGGLAVLTFVSENGFQEAGVATIDIEDQDGEAVAQLTVTVEEEEPEDADADEPEAEPAPAGGAAGHARRPRRPRRRNRRDPAQTHDVEFDADGPVRFRLNYSPAVVPQGAGAGDGPANGGADAPDGGFWRNVLIGLTPIALIMIVVLLIWLATATTANPPIPTPPPTPPGLTNPGLTEKVIKCPDPCEGSELIAAIKHCAGGKNACRKDADCRKLCEADVECRDWLQ